MAIVYGSVTWQESQLSNNNILIIMYFRAGVPSLLGIGPWDQFYGAQGNCVTARIVLQAPEMN